MQRLDWLGHFLFWAEELRLADCLASWITPTSIPSRLMKLLACWPNCKMRLPVQIGCLTCWTNQKKRRMLRMQWIGKRLTEMWRFRMWISPMYRKSRWLNTWTYRRNRDSGLPLLGRLAAYPRNRYRRSGNAHSFPCKPDILQKLSALRKIRLKEVHQLLYNSEHNFPYRTRSTGKIRNT